MSSDSRFLKLAIELAARKSRSGRNGPFGALVVKDGRAIGSGWNRVVETADPTAHAEVVAIRAACRRLRSRVLAGCALYASCEPCPMCLAAIYWARLDRVVFACARADAAAAGFDDKRIYREIAGKPDRRSVPCRQMLRRNGLRVFRNWTANPRRILY
ncbi:MAG: nucleoside deaminase [Verrucomicrobiota bacterium]|nr:nucleoside deaminase [Verrucomicrobiota bacterium]